MVKFFKRKKTKDNTIWVYQCDWNKPDELHKELSYWDENYKDYIDINHIYHNDYIVYDGKKIQIIHKWDFEQKYKGFHGFDKSNRSSFSYWFAHWCAFQMCALNLRRWKFKYLFHDIEKPWMKLFMKYKSVQQWHRYHNSHHLEYGLKHGWDKVDWECLIIDWECSRFTKTEAQLDAYETMELELKTKWKDYINYISPLFYPKLYEMNL